MATILNGYSDGECGEQKKADEDDGDGDGIEEDDLRQTSTGSSLILLTYCG